MSFTARTAEKVQQIAANSEFIGKDEAAQRLGISVRSFQALVASGKIERKLERDPATNQNVARYRAGDVERVAYQRQHPEESPQPAQGTADMAPQSPARGQNGHILTELLRHFALATPSASSFQPHHKAWLTLEEAAEYCGLSRGLLLRLVRRGKLPAFQDQPIKLPGEKRAKAGSSWRVCRRDLDSLRGILAPMSACQRQGDIAADSKGNGLQFDEKGDIIWPEGLE